MSQIKYKLMTHTNFLYAIVTHYVHGHQSTETASGPVPQTHGELRLITVRQRQLWTIRHHLVCREGIDNIQHNGCYGCLECW